MSINRVDFQGAIVRTSDYTSVKQNEDTKVYVDQAQSQTQNTKDVDERRTTVTRQDDADPREQKFDAKEKGSNEYFRQEGRRRSKEEVEELEKLAEGVIGKNGKPINLGFSSGFDFKI